MKVPQDQGIWVDVFELSRYRGTRRRLYGPSVFPSIRSRSVREGISIDSIVVGPRAYVRLFRAAEKDGRCIWLLPRQGVEDVVEIHADDEFDSLVIVDRPPAPGEAGYEAFQATSRKQKPATESRA